MEKNQWEKIGNRCLAGAEVLLKQETVTSAATAETVKSLVETAISIDLLNLRWAEQSRCGAVLFADRPSLQPSGEN